MTNLHDLDNFLGVNRGKRSSKHGEVLREDEDGSSGDLGSSRDDRISGVL